MWDYSEYEHIKVEVADRIATVTLNRPDALNAVTSRMHHELENVWLDLGSDRDVNAILLTGAGRAFCAGADLRGVAELTSGKAKRGRFDRGAIDADAIGLGATLALLCDIIVVSEKARFADTHVKIGVVAGDGGAVIWPLLIGPHRAKEFLMRGNFINGAEAGRIGMVNYAVPPEEVMTKALALAQELADGPTWAIRWSKLAVNKWLKEQANLIMDTGLAYEMMTFKTEDHKEAVSAFV